MELVRSLPPKWNPLSTLPEDYEPDSLPEPEDKNSSNFDWKITTTKTLTDAFRIFTEGDQCKELPDRSWSHRQNELDPITAYTDGSCSNNADGPVAGAGVHLPGNTELDRAIRIPEALKQTNQTGEIIAIKEAVGIIDKSVALHIQSDSKTFINGLTKHLPSWEDKDFLEIENEQELRSTISLLRKREAPTTLTWVKGHSGIAGNEEADKLANLGRNKQQEDEINLDVQPQFKLTGLRLSKITQSMAEKAIKRKKAKSSAYQRKLQRRATIRSLGMAQATAAEINGSTPSETALWKSIRNRDITKRIQFFLWMLYHDAYKVGDYWEQIPGFEHRANCQHCRVPETMEHILLECTCPGQQVIWDLAKQTWSHQKSQWVTPSLGTILACGAINLRTPDDKRAPGDSRLFRIIVSESAHLIWKLQNERVINGTDPISVERITKRWRTAIEGRYKLDCTLTSNRFGKRQLAKKTVNTTWQHVVRVSDDPSQKPWGGTGVLVGARDESVEG
ncbi:hypothetical protein C8R42DRAFT_591672 [Lentinula raphanica]|nr:hypothetical protein C8R42DRAFT_591672 [Lentinula raphanica]